MLYQRSYQPELSTLQLDKKYLQKRRRIFRRDREPSRTPVRTQERQIKNALRNFEKYNTIKLKSRTKRYSLIISL